MRDLYWKRYVDFYNAFGLKLNYSVKNERGSSMVHLLKRVEKKKLKLEDEMQREVSIK